MNQIILNLAHPELHYTHNINVCIGKFPDGEPTVEIKGDMDMLRKSAVRIITRITSPEELFILQLLCDILNRNGIVFKIYISYLMCQRMDRVMDFDRPYSLHVISTVLNSLGARSIIIEEPHSDKVFYEINNSFSRMDLANFVETCMYVGNRVFVYPDLGAKTRYSNIFKEEPCIQYKKVRDLETGNIKNIELDAHPDEISFIKHNNLDNLIIFDDLIDGGRTVLSIYDDLKKKFENKTIIVAATHAVNKEGLQKICDNCDKVIITNSYDDYTDMKAKNDNLSVINVFDKWESFD